MFKNVYDIISDQEGDTIDVISQESKNAFIAKHNDVLFDPLSTKLVIVVFLPASSYKKGIEGVFNDCLEDSYEFEYVKQLFYVLYNTINVRLAYLSVFPEYIERYNVSEKEPTVVFFKDTKELCRYNFDQLNNDLTISNIVSKFNEYV